MPSQEDRSLYLPMLLHGDGGAFQSSDSINVISMRSFLSSANVATSQLLLLAIPKACCNKSSNSEEDTMTALWNVLQWSFNAMWCGKWPEKDHLGEAWHPKSYRHSKAGSALNSNGYCGWLFGITCDGEYQQNEFGLQGHSYNQCCFSCKADKDSIPHNDYRPNALWRTTCIKHKGTCPTNHPIAGVKGVVGETWAYDILHVLELGVTGHLLANITFDFVMKPTWPGSQEERLVHLQEMIMHQYQEQGTDHSCRIRRLTWSNFCSVKSKWDNFPHLSGLKAKQVRHLVPVYLEICKAELPNDNYSRHKLAALEHLNNVYALMDQEGLHMSKAASKSLLKSMNLCLVHYTKLASICIGKNLLQYSTVHKHHLSAHLAMQAEWANPKYMSTYTGETMVGLMSSLAHSCLNGTPPHLVPGKVCWRFRLGMHLRFLHDALELPMSDDDD